MQLNEGCWRYCLRRINDKAFVFPGGRLAYGSNLF